MAAVDACLWATADDPRQSQTDRRRPFPPMRRSTACASGPTTRIAPRDTLGESDAPHSDLSHRSGSRPSRAERLSRMQRGHLLHDVHPPSRPPRLETAASNETFSPTTTPSARAGCTLQGTAPARPLRCISGGPEKTNNGTSACNPDDLNGGSIGTLVRGAWTRLQCPSRKDHTRWSGAAGGHAMNTPS